MIFKPDLVFLDEAGNEITDFYFESVKRGDTTNIHTLKIKNRGDPCHNVTIKPVSVDYLVRRNDTMLSTFLSLNLKDFSPEIKLAIDTDEIIPFYLKWQPPYNAVLGAVKWGLAAMIDMNQGEELTC